MRPDDRQGIPVIECWEDVNSTALVDDDTQSAKQGKTFTMKPTPTPEMIEALEVARDQIIAMYRTWVVDDATAMPTEISLAGRAIAKIDAALSVPAAAVVGEQLRTMLEQAYKEGFEASGEGFNAEYHHDFETDNEWLADRDIAVSGLIATALRAKAEETRT